MYTVGDAIELAKYTVLASLNVVNSEKALLRFVNLGVSELFGRFNLAIKTESIITTPNQSLYELKDDGVVLLLTVYNSFGEELFQTDVINGLSDYKILNYRSFLLTHPREDLLFAVYKASPPSLNSMDDPIPLPDTFSDALLCYMGYLGHTAINKDNVNETSAFAKKFENSCINLENQGFKIPLGIEMYNQRLRGFK